MEFIAESSVIFCHKIATLAVQTFLKESLSSIFDEWSRVKKQELCGLGIEKFFFKKKNKGTLAFVQNVSNSSNISSRKRTGSFEPDDDTLEV